MFVCLQIEYEASRQGDRLAYIAVLPYPPFGGLKLRNGSPLKEHDCGGVFWGISGVYKRNILIYKTMKMSPPAPPNLYLHLISPSGGPGTQPTALLRRWTITELVGPHAVSAGSVIRTRTRRRSRLFLPSTEETFRGRPSHLAGTIGEGLAIDYHSIIMIVRQAYVIEIEEVSTETSLS